MCASVSQAILCFPCNQFGHQENSSGDEIINALKHVRPGNGFEPKGIIFDKVGLDFCGKAHSNLKFRWVIAYA